MVALDTVLVTGMLEVCILNAILRFNILNSQYLRFLSPEIMYRSICTSLSLLHTVHIVHIASLPVIYMSVATQKGGNYYSN